jgi:hypothetical protein
MGAAAMQSGPGGRPQVHKSTRQSSKSGDIFEMYREADLLGQYGSAQAKKAASSRIDACR